MIAPPPDRERAWLQAFFGPPNALTWEALETGSARQDQIDAVAPWIARLSSPTSDTPLILPFYRGAHITGWYATALTREGEQSLRSSLRAWLGASYLTVFQSAADTNPSAIPMRERFGREVVSFTGPEPHAIAARLALLARLEVQRPRLHRSEPRPVGRIRSDLEHALLARDETTALARIAELRSTGRLNEENLQFLDIRLKAGLGQWQQIALDHWAIRNLSDLPLPPQTLSDLVEALYRVYVDDIDAAAGPSTILAAFKEDILDPFPRLFASRHGVRTPRVVKAFILHESLQTRPSAHILTSLANLLPEDQAAWAEPFLSLGEQMSPGAAAHDAPDSRVAGPRDVAADVAVAQPPVSSGTSGGAQPETEVDEGEIAFEDGQIDRAFEIDLARPLHRKSLMRLLSCAQFIGTADAQSRLVQAFDAQPDLRQGLSVAQIERVEALRPVINPPEDEANPVSPSTGWLDWARRLAARQDLDNAAADALDNRTTWDACALRANATNCAEFADLIGNLDRTSAEVARQALPLIVSAFFPDDEPPTVAAKPVAQVVLLLIALDEAVARVDLETLSSVVSVLLELGLTTVDYLTMVEELEAVQQRVSSYANLAWSLDICEALAVAPAPSSEASGARLRFFLGVISGSQSFAHRLAAADLLPIEYLAHDYGVDPASIAALRPASSSREDPASSADLSGKLIGIYTLIEAAGARAKSALESLYPGCQVEVNSDTVGTTSLTNLARTADLFIFAWRSSSHQAFYCVKEALGGRDPVYAAGKGTASIVNAVREAAS